MTRVLLVDDEPLIRHGIGLILRGEEGIEVVGVADNGRQAVERAQDLQPDVVLMDVRMPVMDGVEATRQIIEHTSPSGHESAVLILSTYNADDAVRGALRAGASGFVLKDAEPDELVAAVRAVAKGDAWLDPAVAKRLLADFKGRPETAVSTAMQLDRLTPREIEVLVLIAHGLSNAAIADHLFIAEATAKTHLNRLLMKLGLHDRAQAVATAYRSGLVAPNDPLPSRP